eukprot:5964098-Amphidinium_carterae.1
MAHEPRCCFVLRTKRAAMNRTRPNAFKYAAAFALLQLSLFSCLQQAWFQVVFKHHWHSETAIAFISTFGRLSGPNNDRSTLQLVGTLFASTLVPVLATTRGNVRAI